MRLGRPRGRAALPIGLVAVLMAGTLGAAALVAVRTAAGPPDQPVGTIGLAATAGTPAEAVAPPSTTTSGPPTVPAVVTTAATTPPARQTATSITARPPATHAPPPSSTTTTWSPTITTTPAPVPTSTSPFAANGTWSGESNGITMSLTMTPATPRAGQTVHFTITASSPTTYCCLTDMYFGDGTFVLPGPTNDPCHTGDPAHFRQELDHVYSAPGTYPVQVDPSVLVCAAGPPTLIQARLVAAVVVAPAT